MTWKVHPTENYWTEDVKMTSKVQPTADYWMLTEKTWGQECVIFGEQKNKERNGETSLRTEKYFELLLHSFRNIIEATEKLKQ